ncbi:MAG: hypothetical protein IPK97_03535 [Ahniella sp.]|nr:hypothetical protein [Ahniella sp.]
MNTIAGLILAAALAAPTSPEPDVPPLGQPAMVGMMHSAAIAEVSGLAASRRHERLLWAVNDSDHPAALEALDRHGKHLHSVDVTGARNVDWEDLVAYSAHGKPMLLIADIGDNGGLRSALTLYLVEEPELSARQVSLAGRIDVRFDDGPHDVEALFVDERESMVYLISKRQIPPVLYAVPLKARAKPVRARNLGSFASIPRASHTELQTMPRFARYFGQATSAVADPAGRFVAVLTYRDAYLFRRAQGQQWIDALRATPAAFGLPFMPQAEAMTFAADTREFLITTENLPAPILSVQLPDASP